MSVCLNAIKLQAVAFAIPAKVRAEVLAGDAQKWGQKFLQVRLKNGGRTKGEE